MTRAAERLRAKLARLKLLGGLGTMEMHLLNGLHSDRENDLRLKGECWRPSYMRHNGREDLLIIRRLQALGLVKTKHLKAGVHKHSMEGSRPTACLYVTITKAGEAWLSQEYGLDS